MKTIACMTVALAVAAPALAGGDNPLQLSTNLSWTAAIGVTGNMVTGSASSGGASVPEYMYAEASDYTNFRASVFAHGTSLEFAPNQVAADSFDFYAAQFGATGANSSQFLTVTFAQDVIIGAVGGGLFVESGPSYSGMSLNMDFIGYTLQAGTYTFSHSTGFELGNEEYSSLAVYTTAVPAPGAIALLGLAGLAGRRRR
jgi:MYXO-CTERM domain-containing protein